MDGFAGSGVVSRALRRYAAELVVNDFEDYAGVLGRCFMTNRSEFPDDDIRAIVERLNAKVSDLPVPGGFIERLYAPRDEGAITSEDRVFYTRQNACRLDSYRQLIEAEPKEYRDWLLGPLLSEASVHANTAGVFKGFYKDSSTGIGRYGGSGADALVRIRGPIRLETPILSRYDSQVEVFQEDANKLAQKVGDFDVAYFDPPYNQHPYGSNYFMLNLLTNYEEPSDVSRVSGIPVNWQRSDYNVRAKSLPLVADLIDNTDARFVLLSYNDEGFIRIEDMRRLLESFGTVAEVQTEYATFRGSRNLRGRALKVTEHLFLIEKSGS
jgi:adenine-specific DNA-methyltransferase